MIGRKIYFNTTTGEKILEISSKVGFFKSSTVEEDIEHYKVLTERNLETFDFIQLEYGQYDEDFAESNGYRIVLSDANLEEVELTPNEGGTIYSIEGFDSKYSLSDVKVFVDGVELEDGYSVELKTIVFDEPQIKRVEDEDDSYSTVTVKELKKASLEFSYPDPNEPDDEQELEFQEPLSEIIDSNMEYLVDVDFRLSMIEMEL